MTKRRSFLPKVHLDDTGERMIPEHHKGNFMYGEHMLRYQAAAPLVKDKIVLDIASGSGYGSSILAKTAKKVYGVDIDKTSVEYARQNYSKNNLEFLIGNATDIPVADNKIEAVVSFETIEHIADYRKFISEIKRVLKKDGVAIISTPNDVEFSEDNHFHQHEFKYREFTELLESRFKKVKIFFQGAWISNALLSKEQLSSEWEQTMEVINLAPKDTNKAIYFFAIVSDADIQKEIVPLLGISEHWSMKDLQEAQKMTEVHIQNLDAMIEIEKQKLQQRDYEAQQLKDELSLIKSSLLWKIFKRVHVLKNKIKLIFNR